MSPGDKAERPSRLSRPPQAAECPLSHFLPSQGGSGFTRHMITED